MVGLLRAHRFENVGSAAMIGTRLVWARLCLCRRQLLPGGIELSRVHGKHNAAVAGAAKMSASLGFTTAPHSIEAAAGRCWRKGLAASLTGVPM